MYTLFVVLALISGVLLALVVLIQESKGGGLASNVSGANAVLGVRKTTDFVEKATWWLAALLVAFCVACSFFDSKEAVDPSTVVTSMPAATTPQLPAAGQAQPAAPVAPQK